MTKHTPTPWFVERDCIHNNEVEILMLDGIVGKNSRPEEYKANAEFILRAVNCHDDLVKALDGLYSSIKAGKLNLNQALADTRAALAKAKG